MSRPTAGPTSRARRRASALALTLAPVLLPALGAVACHRAEPVARLASGTHELALPHGRHVEMTIRWEPLTDTVPGAAPTVFLHLLDAQRNIVRTFDHELPAPWQKGQELVDTVGLYHSALGPALPPGEYELTAGLYSGKKRYPLQVEEQASPRKEYTLAKVMVPDAAGGPGFTFSPEWLPVEPGGDRQTVAWRWLSGDGTIEVHGMPTGGRLWIVLRLPKVEPPLRLVLEPGATTPMAIVKQDCGGFSATVSGDGFHELTVPVPAPACRISFDSNFTVVEMGRGRKLSVRLEQLGWDTGSPATPAAP